MQATRFWAAALLALSTAASSQGCGDGDAPSPSRCKPCGGEGGGLDGLGGAGLGGDDSNASGSAALPNGGAAAAANVGGAAGDAGADSHGARAGAGGAGSGGEGGDAMSKGEQLDLCVRLTQPHPNGDQVGRFYTAAVTLDCRVKWIMPKGQSLPDFQNQVRLFNPAFWGCPHWPPVETFGIVFGTPPLSQGDVDLLIGHYLNAAQDTVNLSPLERQEMQAALVRLSKPLIVDASLEPSNSVCPVNMGGAGGAGAGGADAGGAGGATANSAGGAR